MDLALLCCVFCTSLYLGVETTFATVFLIKPFNSNAFFMYLRYFFHKRAKGRVFSVNSVESVKLESEAYEGKSFEFRFVIILLISMAYIFL